MAQKQKYTFPVKLDAEMYKKFLAIAKAEGRTPNNHFLYLLRTNIAYYERIHGKLDTSAVTLPVETEEKDAFLMQEESGA